RITSRRARAAELARHGSIASPPPWGTAVVFQRSLRSIGSRKALPPLANSITLQFSRLTMLRFHANRLISAQHAIDWRSAYFGGATCSDSAGRKVCHAGFD